MLSKYAGTQLMKRDKGSMSEYAIDTGARQSRPQPASAGGRCRHMVTFVGGITATLVSILTGLLPLVARARAVDVTACIHETVHFDGRRPLQFDRVTGSPGTRLYMHAVYPKSCFSSEVSYERGHVYLLTGDEVAIGKSCGKWAYVQYIGDRRVTKGWVENSRLAFVQKAGQGTAKWLFTLTKGRGTSVCEAYLQRLNVTDYAHDRPGSPAPYCGIPRRLTRVWNNKGAVP